MNSEISILFKNEQIIAVDKPVGISIHNAEDATNLIAMLSDQLAVADRKAALFPVHRLDKETSGVQLFAFSDTAAAKYAIEFQSRNVRKIYVGVLRGALKEDEGVWSASLTDKAEGRSNPAGLAHQRVACETRFRVLRKSKFFSFCEFDLTTGRQHQIRKHAALAGHALVGDARYGDSKYNRRMADLYGTARMFLHCASLEILGQKINSPAAESFEQLVPKS